MDKIYSDPRHPGSYASVERLYQASRKQNLGQTRKSVAKFLSGVPAYTLHKQRRYKFKRNKYIIKKIDDLWQADLADLSSLAAPNDHVRYLLVVIDSFSKFMWVKPLKRKTASSVHDAIVSLLADAYPRKPDNFMVDKGGEFRNNALRDYMKQENINFYSTKNPDTKAAIAERSIRTLKGRIYRYLTQNHTKRYLDTLDDIVHGYNASKHRSIGMAPDQVNQANESEVRHRLYPGKVKPSNKFPFQVGDTVRLAKERTSFQKGYHPMWTEEVFRIVEVVPRDPPVARVVDWQGEQIDGTFYKEEIQKVEMAPDAVYRVEQVIETRELANGKQEYLVKWLGYPSSMNSWISDEDLTFR